MIQEQALSDAAGWVNVDAKELRHTHLHEVCEVAAAFSPEPIGNAVRLDCLKPFEVQQRLDVAVASWIAVFKCRVA